MKKLTKKLSFDSQTIALLSNADLRQVAGGNVMTSRTCPASAFPESCVNCTVDCPPIVKK